MSTTTMPFGISANGYYRYRMRFLGDEKKLIDWTPNSNIFNKGFNYLTVKKKENKLEFIINNQKVNEYTFNGFYGDNIGFCVVGKQTILFDDIKVNYIEETLNNEDEKIIFADDFGNNINAWAESDDKNVFFKVSNGKYIVEHKRDFGW